MSKEKLEKRGGRRVKRGKNMLFLYLFSVGEIPTSASFLPFTLFFINSNFSHRNQSTGYFFQKVRLRGTSPKKNTNSGETEKFPEREERKKKKGSSVALQQQVKESQLQQICSGKFLYGFTRIPVELGI